MALRVLQCAVSACKTLFEFLLGRLKGVRHVALQSKQSRYAMPPIQSLYGVSPDHLLL
jgi:hypothetical protein